MSPEDCGRLGGIARAKILSPERRCEIGRKGGLAGKGITRQGRPRSLTLEELLAGTPLQRIKNIGGNDNKQSNTSTFDVGKGTNNLRTLKRMYLARIKERGNNNVLSE